MNPLLTEVHELRQYAEDRLAAHLTLIAPPGNTVTAEGREQRKKVFNEQLIRYIDELNQKCRELSGDDCEGGKNKNLYVIINEYQDRFMSKY